MIIKKLQQLKAKKGFTLVELLVVIAIIGILAAILIPLMAGFLDSARVSNANTTAKSARDMMTNWLSDQSIRNRNTTAGAATYIIIHVAVGGMSEGTATVNAAGALGTGGIIAPSAPQSGPSINGLDIYFETSAANAGPWLAAGGSGAKWNLAGYSQHGSPVVAAHSNALVYDLARVFYSQFQSARNCTFIFFIGGSQGTCLQTAYLPNVLATQAEMFATAATRFVGDSSATGGNLTGVTTTAGIAAANFVPGTNTFFFNIMDGKFTETGAAPIVRNVIIGTNLLHA